MVNLRGFRIAAVFQTLLTQRVSVNEAVSYPFPCPSVFSFGVSIPVILFVVFVVELLVFFTEPCRGELRTAGIGAGCFRLVGQDASSFSNKKAPRDIPPRLVLFYFAIIIIIEVDCDTLCQSVPTFNPGQKNAAELNRGYGALFVRTR